MNYISGIILFTVDFGEYYVGNIDSEVVTDGKYMNHESVPS